MKVWSPNSVGGRALLSALAGALLLVWSPRGAAPGAGDATAALPLGPVPVASAQGGCPPSGSATNLTGAGATFPAPLYTRWFAEYANMCGVQINYQAIGSGGGINQHTSHTVDFGASDGILTQAQFDAAPGTIMIPMTAGAEAIIVNLSGVQRGQINLTPDALAGIFLGDITKWNDPRITVSNPDTSLPDQDIIVVHRSDGSGTTFIFTNYLSKVSQAWASRVGSGTSVNWPTGLGGEQNAGVAGQVAQLPGSIGYVELAYAIQSNLVWTKLQNAAGVWVEPSLDGVTVAMNGVQLPDNMQVVITNSEDPDAFPIAGFTWILAYQNQTDLAKARTLTSFLWWAIHDGQQDSPSLLYAPLSEEAVSKAEALIGQIQYNGQPVIQM